MIRKRGIVTFLISIVLIGTVFGAVVNGDLDTDGNNEDKSGSRGLIGYWSFDEGSGVIAQDSSGNSNDGAIHGATWVSGISGYALQFDGINDYVDIGSPPELDINYPITIEAWIKRDSFQGPDDIVSHGDGGYVFYFGNMDRLALSAQGGTGGGDSINSITTISDTGFHHLIVTYDGVIGRIYIDGQLDNSVTTQISFNNLNSLWFGGCVDYGEYFHGVIDEIKIYNSLYYQMPDTVYVDDDYTSSTSGWGYNHFDVIQNGIDAVAEDGAVYVYDGIYYEHIIVNRTINLFGQDKNTTIIDGGESGKVVDVSSNWVNISGFAIQNGDWGIFLSPYGESDYSTITDNTLKNLMYDAITLYGSYCNITSNIIKDNGQDGISCSNPTLGHHNIIMGNIIKNNSQNGISLSSDNNFIFGNTITSHNINGIFLVSNSNNNILYYNNLDNINNARDTGTNTWDNGYPSGGNYWSDYAGYDIYHGSSQDIPGGDGVGDTPYNITGGSNQDMYPFMNPLDYMALYTGWNLITVPFVNNWTAETLGQDIPFCEVVTMFNASTQGFLTHVVGIPHDDFPIMDGVGYFVYVTVDSVFAMRGVPIMSVNVAIEDEWNIVGWYHDYSTMAESLGDNITGASVVTMFNAISQTFLTHVVNIPHDDFTITRGMGLYIYTDEASVWHGEG